MHTVANIPHLRWQVCIHVNNAKFVVFFEWKYLLYFLQYATANAEHTKNKSKSDCFIWTDVEDKLLLKVCIECKTSKDKAVFPLV